VKHLKSYAAKQQILITHKLQLAARSSAEARKKQERAIIIAIGFAVLLLTVVSMANVVVGRMVVNPIRRLDSAIQQAEEGNYDVQLAYTSKDEVGSLYFSYQKMLHNITSKTEEVHSQSLEIERQQRILEVQAQYLERANASLRQNNVDLRQFMQREFLRIEEMTRHKDTLISIAREEAIHSGNMKLAFERITELGALHLDVGRVSIWLFRNGRGFVGTPQLHELELIDLYDSKADTHSEAAWLKAEDYPHYFTALETLDFINASDAIHDKNTTEFTEQYLKPLGIGAMLDVPIRDGNIVVGVLCAEHIGGTRKWSIEEQIFARSLSGFVTTALDAREKLRQRDRLLDLNKEMHKMPQHRRYCTSITRTSFSKQKPKNSLRQTDICKTSKDFSPKSMCCWTMRTNN
jgi:HAMP domain-containing protein